VLANGKHVALPPMLIAARARLRGRFLQTSSCKTCRRCVPSSWEEVVQELLRLLDV